MSGKTIIFDFDGTIANTLDTAVNVYNQIADEYNCKVVKPEDRIRLQATRPQEFIKEYISSNSKLPFVILRIRKEMRKCIAEIEPTDGILEVLKEIKNSGFMMGIMTSNSRKNVNIFLEANGIADLFDFVYSGKKIFGKDKIMKRVLRDQKITRDEVVYIGDETRDIEAAKKAKIPIISVTWGFNSKEILKCLEPTALVDSPKQLLNSLNKF